MGNARKRLKKESAFEEKQEQEQERLMATRETNILKRKATTRKRAARDVPVEQQKDLSIITEPDARRSRGRPRKNPHPKHLRETAPKDIKVVHFNFLKKKKKKLGFGFCKCIIEV